MANRLRRRTSDQTVLGSNPAVAAALSPWTRLFTPIVPRRNLHISFYQLFGHPCKIYTGKKKKKKKNVRSVKLASKSTNLRPGTQKTFGRKNTGIQTTVIAPGCITSNFLLTSRIHDGLFFAFLLPLALLSGRVLGVLVSYNQSLGRQSQLLIFEWCCGQLFNILQGWEFIFGFFDKKICAYKCLIGLVLEYFFS